MLQNPNVFAMSNVLTAKKAWKINKEKHSQMGLFVCSAAVVVNFLKREKTMNFMEKFYVKTVILTKQIRLKHMIPGVGSCFDDTKTIGAIRHHSLTELQKIICAAIEKH